MNNAKRERATTTRCLHCGAVHPLLTSMPLASDDTAWNAIIAQHRPGCTWANSRAGRVKVARQIPRVE